MSLNTRNRTRISAAALAVAATTALAVASPPSAMAASAASSPDYVTSGTTAGGNSYQIKSLSLSQAKAQGLGKYINAAQYKQSVPPAMVESAARKATRAPSGEMHTMASGCWSFTMGYSIANNWMWGKGDVTWCGGGTWVTYTTSNCYGGSWYPTYNYEGCAHYPNYGKGWSLYQVKNTWNFCIVYVPLWGSCVSHQYPWKQYQFTGGGKVLFNGGW